MIPTKRPIPQKPRRPQPVNPQPEAAEYDDMPDDGDRHRGKGWILALCIGGAVAIGAGAYLLLRNNHSEREIEDIAEELAQIEQQTYREMSEDELYPVDLGCEVETDSVGVDDGHCSGYDHDGNAVYDDMPEDVITVRCIDDFPPVEEAPQAEEYEPAIDNKIFTAVEEMPQFPGGEAALLSWIADNLVYPAEAAGNNIQGRVVVQFVVNRDGTIGDVKVARGKDPNLDREAIRVVKKLPRFKPGRMNGQPVNVWYTLPILFKLQG